MGIFLEKIQFLSAYNVSINSSSVNCLNPNTHSSHIVYMCAILEATEDTTDIERFSVSLSLFHSIIFFSQYFPRAKFCGH